MPVAKRMGYPKLFNDHNWKICLWTCPKAMVFKLCSEDYWCYSKVSIRLLNKKINTGGQVSLTDSLTNRVNFLRNVECWVCSRVNSQSTQSGNEAQQLTSSLCEWSVCPRTSSESSAAWAAPQQRYNSSLSAGKEGSLSFYLRSRRPTIFHSRRQLFPPLQTQEGYKGLAQESK